MCMTSLIKISYKISAINVLDDWATDELMRPLNGITFYMMFYMMW